MFRKSAKGFWQPVYREGHVYHFSEPSDMLHDTVVIRSCVVIFRVVRAKVAFKIGDKSIVQFGLRYIGTALFFWKFLI